MAASALLVRQGFLVLALTLISLTSSHRLSGHPYFKSKTNDPLWTSTTPGSTEKVVIDDKMPGPSVKYPSAGQVFLDYLLNRDTYFANAGSGSKSNTGSGVTNTYPTTDLTSTSPDTTSNRPESTSETTVAKTSTTETTSTTTRTTTTTRNNQVRPDQLPFNDEPQAQDRDRPSRYLLADLWLQRFRRPSILDPRVRSGDAGSGSITDGKKDSVSASPSPSNGNNNQGAVEIDRNGAVYVVYDKQTESSKTSTLSVGDKRGTTPLPPLDVQDKPYYGSSLGLYFHDNRTAENNVSDSSENETNGVKDNGRSRRAANVGSGNGTSCAEPRQFQPCQYYQQCFHNLTDTCSSRNSFLGNVFSRFCSKAVETSRSARSLLLSSYLRDVEMCIREELVKVVEYPSCSEVTSTLQDALFLRRPGSCLYQREKFCNVLADDVARPTLARMFNSTEDVQFMFRVMVNIANIASYCGSQGASIFMTDITLLVTSTDSPYRDLVGSTPIPGIVPKY